jgi:LDH2 family malate/lactate/ureidoglycolate dehydrogenase
LKPPESEPIRYSANRLRVFLGDALRACGLSENDAVIAAGAMVEADLAGADAHGVFRLSQYVREIRRGAINPKATIQIVERWRATALVDGQHGMGHLVMTNAAGLAVELAREFGVGWVGARRSNHAGAGAIYASIPVEHGMIGIYGAGSSVNHMAPWGGTEPLLGTNPIAVAIPAGEEAPVVLDIATSAGSNGTIRTLELQGKPLPQGWIQARQDGAPITDPQRANEGTYVPMGAHKGSGLSFVIGVLAGVLNGAAFGREVHDFAAARSGATNVGQFIIALDVARFMAPELFKAQIDRHIRDFVASRPMPGGEQVRVPGQARMARRNERERLGVPLDPGLVQQLDELAKSLAIVPLSGRA